MKHNRALVLLFLLVIFGCSRGDDTNRLDCPAKVEPVTAVLHGGFLLPNGFTPNGDGKNDILGLITTDSLAVRSAELRFSDASGTVLYTITQVKQYWDGWNHATNKAYPAGTYRVDYNIVLNGKGITADSTVSGHNCIWLFGNHPTKPGAVQAPADVTLLNKIVFGDMVDPQTLAHPYTTAENFDL